METMSWLHWVVMLICAAIVGIPVARILRRIGLSRWLTILAFVPGLNLIGLWIVAYVRWPAIPAD